MIAKYFLITASLDGRYGFKSYPISIIVDFLGKEKDKRCRLSLPLIRETQLLFFFVMPTNAYVLRSWGQD